MKRGLPSGEGELDLDQLWVRRTCVLCTPNHLSFKGMFTFAHFSPRIVPEEAELVRMPMGPVSARLLPLMRVWSPDPRKK